jgi:hypothetical protein
MFSPGYWREREVESKTQRVFEASSWLLPLSPRADHDFTGDYSLSIQFAIYHALLVDIRQDISYALVERRGEPNEKRTNRPFAGHA